MKGRSSRTATSSIQDKPGLGVDLDPDVVNVAHLAPGRNLVGLKNRKHERAEELKEEKNAMRKILITSLDERHTYGSRHIRRS